MSLHGSLETFALPDVLTLLSSTRKTGELRVVGGRLDGKVWVTDGKVVGSDVGRATTVVDAVFELLRLRDGTFSFESDRKSPSPSAPVTIEPVLAEAQARLLEWREIEAVVPSLDALVRMADEAPGDEVTMRADQWRMLVVAGRGRPVADLMEALSTCEFDTCRAVKELVEAKLAVVDATDAVAEAVEDVVAEPVVAESEAEAEPVPEPVVAEDEPGPGPIPGPLFGSGRDDDGPGGGGLRDVQRLTDHLREATREGDSDIDSLVEIPSRFRRHQASASVENGESADRGSVATILAAARQGVAEGRLLEADGDLLEATATTGEVRSSGGGTDTGLAGAVAAPGAEDDESGDEPINRGLLLKFLSSVRS